MNLKVNWNKTKRKCFDWPVKPHPSRHNEPDDYKLTEGWRNWRESLIHSHTGRFSNAVDISESTGHDGARDNLRYIPTTFRELSVLVKSMSQPSTQFRCILPIEWNTMFLTKFICRLQDPMKSSDCPCQLLSRSYTRKDSVVWKRAKTFTPALISLSASFSSLSSSRPV